jgi:hypothetical protein
MKNMKCLILNLIAIIILVTLLLIHVTSKKYSRENFIDLDKSNMFTYAGQNLVWVNDPNSRTFNYISSDANNLYIPNEDVYTNASLRYM